MSGKKVTVRKQKIKKNHIREKLIFFTVLTLILLIVAAIARKLCPYDPYAQNLLLAQKPPGPEHILGTDRYGRDMFSRVLVGSTTSIYATLLLVSIVTVTGTVIGLICGWCGGIADTVLMRISDLFLAFPSLVFALAVAGVPLAVRAATKIPARALSNPHITYADILYRFVLIPDKRTAASLLPVAIINRP